MATVVTMHEAKTNLSKLVERAEAGEEIVIAKGKQPKVKLVPIATKPKRQFGSMKGQFAIDERFFEPLPEEELAAWEGR
jgi:prevent-host-death family protein